MRSGLTTYGAQHLVSLSKSASEVERIVGKWDVVQVAKHETESFFSRSYSEVVDIEKQLTKYRAAKPDSENAQPDNQIKYSIAQLCELHEQMKVIALMSK